MTQVFYTFAILACPVGMGLMMWLMMRGGKKSSTETTPPVASAAEVAQLRAELDALRGQGRPAAPVDVVDR